MIKTVLIRFVLWIVLFLLITSGYTFDEEIKKLIYPEKAGYTTGTVVWVHDGDTVKTKLPNGSETSVRLLGINTPEVKSQYTDKDEPYGKEAKSFAIDQLYGKEITLFYSKNPNQQYDIYGRMLAVVAQDDKIFNTRLLENGLAVRLFMANDIINFPAWEKKEVSARMTNLNIWSYGTSGVIINELNPNPSPEPDDLAEFVEIYNTSNIPVNIGNWSFGNNKQTVVPEGTVIPAKGFVILARNNEAEFRKIYPSTPNNSIIINASGSLVLSNTYNPSCGLVVHLRDSLGGYQDSFVYNLNWDNNGANGTGKTLERINPDVENLGESTNDGNWAPSLQNKGTPGTQNSISLIFEQGSLIEAVSVLKKKVLKEGYIDPTGTDTERMRGIVQSLMAGITESNTTKLNDAAVLASHSGYNLVSFKDESLETHYILREKDGFNRGWGSYIFDSKVRSSIIIEVPHPLFDMNTEEIGIKTYLETNGAVFLIAGAHRNANKTGTADVAHFNHTIFEAVHEEVVDSTTCNIQIHGFSQINHYGYPNIVLSAGDGNKPYILRRMTRKMKNKGFSVEIYDGIKWGDLGATTNIQGSYTRGIGGTFINIELEQFIRTNQTEYERVIQAIRDTFMLVHSVGPILDIGSSSTYLVYYDNWNEDKIKKAERFNLVILHSATNITPAIVQDIKDGDDNIKEVDDVIVIGYLSIGEHDVDTPVIGDGSGPGGYASWYLDADNDDYPDKNVSLGSFYVDAGNVEWQKILKTNSEYIINTLKCDGVFLDTVDTASPWGSYSNTASDMSGLIEEIREWYSERYIIVNRGLFYLDPIEDAYKYNIRPYINGVIFECYYTEWDWKNHMGTISPYFNNNKTYWANRVNTEAKKTDGFTVFCLDYLSRTQSDYTNMFANQVNEAINQQGWTDYITDINLDSIRFDLYSHLNPPNIILKKSCNKRYILMGEEIVYTITYTNTGQGIATDLVIIEVLPENVKLSIVYSPQSIVSYYVNGNWQETFSESATKIRWLIPEISPAGSGTVSFTVKVE
jgi:uncharacterized repeat protein (TIGR01451 family)